MKTQLAHSSKGKWLPSVEYRFISDERRRGFNGRNIIQMKKSNFTNAVKNSLEQENWYSALTLALTLPDICGKLENPD